MAKPQLAGLLLAGSLSTSAWAEHHAGPITLSGDLRLGYITAEDATNTRTHAAAAGGRLTLNSRVWHGLRAGVSLYTTQQLGSGSNSELLGSDGNSYSIVGQAYLQAEYAGNVLTLGRFTLDTPHVDSDDIRMVEDNYQGVQLSNRAIDNLTLQLMHLGKWSGYDAPVRQRFTAIGPHGLNAAGVIYDGVTDTSLQAWYYQIPGQARLTYLEALYQGKWFALGTQFGDQSGGQRASGGPDGQVYGLTGSLNYHGFGASLAYNQVSGSVINGLGGGPWFTSADTNTIAGVDGQRAIALGVSYSSSAGLSLSISQTRFRYGSNETDYSASWALTPDTNLALVYANLHNDGDYALALFNYRF